MKLTGKVVKVESGSEFTDKQQRVLIKINEAGHSFSNSLELVNEIGWPWKLDDEIEIFAFRKVQEGEASIEDAVATIPIKEAF